MARILIADDDVATRDLLRRALEADGHKVLAATDGSEALDLLKADAAALDLLITDVQMPGIDGIRLIGEARALKAGLRVLLMSGYPDQLGRAPGTVGQVTTLSKPFSLDKARAEVRAALA
jgi:CheY-like chemotaxis protein